jgi:hypothetical protein
VVKYLELLQQLENENARWRREIRVAYPACLRARVSQGRGAFVLFLNATWKRHETERLRLCNHTGFNSERGVLFTCIT